MGVGLWLHFTSLVGKRGYPFKCGVQSTATCFPPLLVNFKASLATSELQPLLHMPKWRSVSLLPGRGC